MKEKERTRKRGMMKPSRRVRLLLIEDILILADIWIGDI